MSLETRVDVSIESLRRTARIPGVAVAVAMDGQLALSKGYGHRDLAAGLAMTAQTFYPIASTTKSLNATLIALLAEQGQLAWDVPIQNYLPRFRLRDPMVSARVTLRDLVTMRTGLARHDFAWLENPLTRAAMVESLAHLEFSGEFRARFGYNNLTVMLAGHVAEVVAGDRWENLIEHLILKPLGMTRTSVVPLEGSEVTQRYCENERRELIPSPPFTAPAMAPAGAAIHSTVEDMAQWLLVNLDHERASRQLRVGRHAFAELHAPQISGGHDAAAPSSRAFYALGWWSDRYNGHARVSHTGYVPGLSTSMMLFPERGVGLVCFANFGAGKLARLINQYVFDELMGSAPEETLTQRLAQYERAVVDNRQRIAAVSRVRGTSPSHDLDAYRGTYEHPGYGSITIGGTDQTLVFRRDRLSVPLEHWHYDAWAFARNDSTEIHQPHFLDRANRLLFEADFDGRIVALSIQLDSAVGPSRFYKR